MHIDELTAPLKIIRANDGAGSNKVLEASLAPGSLFGNAPGQLFWASETGPLSE